MISEEQLMNDDEKKTANPKVKTHADNAPLLTQSNKTVSFEAKKEEYIEKAESELQRANLAVLDANHITGKGEQGNLIYQVLKNYTVSGKANDVIDFAGADSDIKAFLARNYEINSIYSEGQKIEATDYQTASQDWKFNNQTNNTQHYFIFLNHTTDQINKDNNYGRSDLVKTVTETIHYQDENGDSITKDYVNQATFFAAGGVDKTTGKLIQFDNNGQVLTDELGNWKEIDIADADINDPNNFVWSKEVKLHAYDLPQDLDGNFEIKSISPEAASSDGMKSIMAYQVDHNSEDFTINVTYAVKKNVNDVPAEAVVVSNQVSFVDETTGYVLETQIFEGRVGDEVVYSTKDKIAGYEKEGYVLVHSNFEDGNEVFKPVSAEYQIQLAHGVKEKNIQKVVTCLLSYADENGEKLADPIKNEVEFTYNGYVDQVNGNWVSAKDAEGKLIVDKVIKQPNWKERNASQSAILAKEIDGYRYKTLLGAADAKLGVDLKTGAVDLSNLHETSNNSDLTLIYQKTAAKKVVRTEQPRRLSAQSLAFMNMITLVIPSKLK